MISLLAVDTASAQEGWQWSAEIYGWLPTLSATSQSGYEADIEIDTILEDLNFGFMGNIAAKKDRWTLFADLLYMKLSHSTNGTLELGGAVIDDELAVGLRASITTLGFGYEIAGAPTYNVNVLGGARYLWLQMEVDASVGPVRGGIEGTETYLDAIVGLQGRVDLNDTWYLSGYADVGTGQSDLTWQALAAVGYRFDRFDLVAGYRYLDYEFRDDEPLASMRVYGPWGAFRLSAGSYVRRPGRAFRSRGDPR
jgi:hypothetical protein